MALQSRIFCKRYLTAFATLLPAFSSAIPHPKPTIISKSGASLPPNLSKSIPDAQRVLETDPNVEQFVFCGNLGLGARGHGEGIWAIDEDDEDEDDNGWDDNEDEDDENDENDRDENAYLDGFFLRESLDISDERSLGLEVIPIQHSSLSESSAIIEPQEFTIQRNQGRSLYPKTLFHAPSPLDPYTYYPASIFSSGPTYHLHGVTVPQELHGFHPDAILGACGNVIRGEGDGEKLNWQREEYDERANYEVIWF